jgi:hypothetical protein
MPLKNNRSFLQRGEERKEKKKKKHAHTHTLLYMHINTLLYIHINTLLHMPIQQQNVWERRALQFTVVFTAVFPMVVGLGGIFQGPAALDTKYGHVLSTNLDNHFRYMSGCLFGYGRFLMSAVPTIDQETAKIRVCCSLPFFGAAGRLWAMFVAGTGINFLSLYTTCAEVIFPLTIIIWQARIARFKQSQRQM